MNMNSKSIDIKLSLRFKWQDIFIFLVPLIISAGLFLALFSNSSDNNVAQIIVDGKIIEQIDLKKSADRTIDLKLRYDNIIEIKQGKIGIKSAKCNDKTCVGGGFISRPGQAVVCVPSGLIIKIVGAGDTDAVTG